MMNKKLKSVATVTVLGTILAISPFAIADDIPPADTSCNGYAQFGCTKYIAKFPDERAAIGAGANSVRFHSQPNTCWDLGVIFF